MTTGRRACLRVLAGLAIALPRIVAARPAVGFATLVPDSESAVVIGRAYLAAYGSSDVWRQVSAVLDAGPEQAMPQRFHNCVVRDFAQGDVVTLDGWVLSRVEAQICALVALAADGG